MNKWMHGGGGITKKFLNYKGEYNDFFDLWPISGGGGL